MYSMDNDIDHILVSEDALKAKVNELGAQISRDYAGKDLLLVSILKGSVVFMADLMRAVQIPCAIDFMVVSSYGGANTSSTGLVKIIKDLDADLTGRDVLIVEDSGHRHHAVQAGSGAENAQPRQREDLHHPQQAQPPHGRHRAGLLRL